jgi:hypothetical protein
MNQHDHVMVYTINLIPEKYRENLFVLTKLCLKILFSEIYCISKIRISFAKEDIIFIESYVLMLLNSLYDLV